MNERKRRAWPWMLLFTFLGVAAQFALWPAALADAVYRGVTLPIWSRVAAPLVTAVPGSLSAALALLVLVLLVLALISGRRAARRGLRAVLWLVVIGIFTFPFVFGLGYHTSTIESRLGLATSGQGARIAPAPTPEVELSLAAEAVLGVLIQTAISLETGAGASGFQPPEAGVAASTCLADYLPTVLTEPVPTLPSSVKSLPSGWLLRFGFAGVVNPWLLEPHVDAGLPAAAGLAVALHELAHSAGFAREAEAEAVGLLAGLACADTRVRYAASLRAATTFSELLTPLAREAYLARWPAQATADREAAAQASRHYLASGVADLAARAYDTYLSSQGAADGIDDYARAATIVASAIGRDGVPAPTSPAPSQ